MLGVGEGESTPPTIIKHLLFLRYNITLGKVIIDALSMMASTLLSPTSRRKIPRKRRCFGGQGGIWFRKVERSLHENTSQEEGNDSTQTHIIFNKFPTTQVGWDSVLERPVYHTQQVSDIMQSCSNDDEEEQGVQNINNVEEETMTSPTNNISNNNKNNENNKSTSKRSLSKTEQRPPVTTKRTYGGSRKNLFTVLDKEESNAPVAPIVGKSNEDDFSVDDELVTTGTQSSDKIKIRRVSNINEQDGHFKEKKSIFDFNEDDEVNIGNTTPNCIKQLKTYYDQLDKNQKITVIAAPATVERRPTMRSNKITNQQLVHEL